MQLKIMSRAAGRFPLTIQYRLKENTYIAAPLGTSKYVHHPYLMWILVLGILQPPYQPCNYGTKMKSSAVKWEEGAQTFVDQAKDFDSSFGKGTGDGSLSAVKDFEHQAKHAIWHSENCKVRN
jgi:hypothetical protein